MRVFWVHKRWEGELFCGFTFRRGAHKNTWRNVPILRSCVTSCNIEYWGIFVRQNYGHFWFILGTFLTEKRDRKYFTTRYYEKVTEYLNLFKRMSTSILYWSSCYFFTRSLGVSYLGFVFIFRISDIIGVSCLVFYTDLHETDLPKS